MKKLLIQTDGAGWAFDIHTKYLHRYLSESFEITIQHGADLTIGHFDLILNVGYMPAFRNLCTSRPDLLSKTFLICATGGSQLADRIKGINVAATGRMAGMIFLNNEAMAYWMQNCFPHLRDIPCTAIPHGCDTTVFQYQDQYPDDFTVGFVGRNQTDYERKMKGYNAVLEACQIVGCDLVEANQIDARIPYWRMPEVYAQMHVMAMPATADGCSLAFNEALSCGRPIICGNGYHTERSSLYPAIYSVYPNDVDDLVVAINHIKYKYSERKSRDTLRESALLFAKEHEWKYIIEKYRTFLNICMP
jgi:glycosyltransferase involved in cell wall biosynthesis